VDLLPVAAALVAAGGAALAAVAPTRIALLAGVLATLALIPLCRATLPDGMSWTLSVLAYLVATLLGGYLLWVSMRRSGALLPPTQALPGWAWLLATGVALTVGVVAWPAAVEWLDPGRTPGARIAGWLEAGRWSLGAGLAVSIVGLGRLLAAAEPARLAAGAAFSSAGAWLMVTGLGAAADDLALLAVGLVLPAAAATVAVHSLRPTSDA
jgi:hypothetical protein